MKKRVFWLLCNMVIQQGTGALFLSFQPLHLNVYVCMCIYIYIYIYISLTKCVYVCVQHVSLPMGMCLYETLARGELSCMALHAELV